MGAYTNGPWWADATADVIVVRDSTGDSICGLNKVTGDRLPGEQEANAALISMAPELFRAVCELVDVMRSSDVEAKPPRTCDSDDWDHALDEAEALIELLNEEGVSLDDPDPDGIVILPMPAMNPPVVVLMFKALDGDVAIIVHADDHKKTLIGQWNISAALFNFVQTFLREDGPICGVLRHERKVVGEIGFMSGGQVVLKLGAQTQSVILTRDDLNDIVSLFEER